MIINKSVTLLRINDLERACYDKAVHIGLLKETGREHHNEESELKDMMVSLKDLTHKFIGTKETEPTGLSFNEQVRFYKLQQLTFK